MDINEILVIIVVILIALIFVFLIYFLIVKIYNITHEKKERTIFAPENLVEEQSLLNSMDDKKNIEPRIIKSSEETFSLDNNVSNVGNLQINKQPPINPFGIDAPLQNENKNSIQGYSDGDNKFFN